jgi:hypothetical protein
MNKLKILLLTCLLTVSFLTNAEPVGTSFTYQGELQQQGVPANGAYDFAFELFDSDFNGNSITAAIQLEDVLVIDGVFTVGLNFGESPYIDQKIWLEIGVRDGLSDGAFTALTPRHAINPTPFALYALSGNEGPVGPKGDTGDTGPEGPQGPQGPAGILANDSVTAAIIATGAVVGGAGGDILDDSITFHDIATGSVGAAELAADSVGNEELVENVTFGKTGIDGSISLRDASNVQTLSLSGLAGDITANGTIGAGIIHSTSGGFTFPDGTVQTTAVLSEFKYLLGITQSTTWTVPDNVDHIRVEMWGGGGGGSAGGGGAAGMYTISLVDVVPGSTVTVVIGQGGAKATNSISAASPGTISSVAGSFGTHQAAGGNGAFATTPAYAIYYGTYGSRYFQYQGQNGFANTVSYQQKNSTTFAIVKKYGDGGAVGPDYVKRSVGQTIISNESNGLLIESNSVPLAPFPGGGGGGGISSRDGADGMVVIWY